jgi:hypothetical protein
MLAVPNFARGDVNAVQAPFATGTTFQLGEVLALVSNLVVPASAFTWTTDLATTRTNFVAAMIGVSLQQHITSTNNTVYGNGIPNVVSVGTTGEYWMAISGTAPVWGDLVGLSKNPSSNALLPNTVEKETAAARAIGTVIELPSSTLALVRIKQVLVPPA